MDAHDPLLPRNEEADDMSKAAGTADNTEKSVDPNIRLSTGPGVLPAGSAQAQSQSNELPADDARDQISGAAHTIADEAGRKLSQASHELRGYAERVARQQKQRAASELGRISSTVRGAAEQLEQNQDNTLSKYAGAVAETLEDCAGYLDRRDMKGMLHDAQRAARRRPELVIGGMFVAGVALARLLKATPPEEIGPGASGTKPQPAQGEDYVPSAYRTPGPTGLSGSSLAHRVEAAGGTDRPFFNSEGARNRRFDNEEDL